MGRINKTKKGKLALSASHANDPSSNKIPSLRPSKNDENGSENKGDETIRGKKQRKREVVGKVTLTSRLPSDGILRLNPNGLRGEVKWTKWLPISSKVNYSIFHEFKDKTSSQMIYSNINGIGCKLIQIKKLQAIGSLDTLLNSRYKAVYVDGVKQNNVYFIEGFLEDDNTLKPGDIVKIEMSATPNEKRMRCYIDSTESIPGIGKSFVGIVLGGDSLESLRSSPNATMFVHPVLRYSAGTSLRHKSFDVSTSDIVSVAPFSMRMLDNGTGDRRKWFLDTESKLKDAVCEWSKAIVIIVEPLDTVTPDFSASRSKESNKSTGSRELRKSRFLFMGSKKNEEQQDSCKTETIILAPHSYNKALHGPAFYNSEHLHADEIRRVYRAIFQGLRASALVNPKRRINLPEASKHIFLDRPNHCNLSMGTVHHLAGGLAQPPTSKLIASISIKDIQIQKIHAFIKKAKEKNVISQSTASAWEGRLKFSIEVADVPSFHQKTYEDIKKSAVNGSQYVREHQRAFAYPRNEFMDPRLQNTRCKAIQQSFSIAKKCFSTQTDETEKESEQTFKNKSSLLSNPGSKAAVLLNLIATEPWDTESTRLPMIGHDSISWKINTNSEADRSSSVLKSFDGILKLYLREPAENKSKHSFNLNNLISNTYLRVELKIRDTMERSKQYIVGSVKIPLKKFLNKRWMSFKLDSKKLLFRDGSSIDDSSETMNNNITVDTYMDQFVLSPKSTPEIQAPKTEDTVTEQRIKKALQDFDNDPLRLVLTFSGNPETLKYVSRQAKLIIKGSSTYNEESNEFEDNEIKADEPSFQKKSNVKEETKNQSFEYGIDSDAKNVNTIWIEKQYKHHDFGFPMPKFVQPVNSMMNNKLDGYDWQNCMNSLFVLNNSGEIGSRNSQSSDVRNSSAASVSGLGFFGKLGFGTSSNNDSMESIYSTEKIDLENIVDVSFYACMNVCDTVTISSLNSEESKNIVAHAADGQKYYIAPDAAKSSSFGISTPDELIFLQRRENEQSFITIKDEDIYVHHTQTGVTSCKSTSKVHMRTLSNWKHCKAPDPESKKDIERVSKLLSVDRQICECCLEQRGIPLNASLAERVVAVETGANIATKFCLASTECIPSDHYKLIPGRIKKVNNEKKTVDVIFSTPNYGLNGKTLRLDVPMKRLETLNGQKLSTLNLSTDKIKFETGSIVETKGIPQLISYMQNWKGYICSLCFDKTHMREESCWIELAKPPSEASAAVIKTNFVNVRDGDNNYNKDPVKSFDRIQFGRHPLDRTVLCFSEESLGSNVKQHRGSHALKRDATLGRSSSLFQKSPHISLIVYRRKFKQARKHFSNAASKLLRLENFDTGTNPDINIVSSIISLSRKISCLLGKHGPFNFQEACTFLKCRASDFVMQNTSKFDFRGNLKQSLAPLHGLLSMTCTMIESDSQKNLILSLIFGSKLPDGADNKFWECCTKIIFNYTALFFGEIRHETLLDSQSKRIGHTATSINNSTVIIGGTNAFSTPNAVKPQHYSPVDHPRILKQPSTLANGPIVFDHKEKTFYPPDFQSRNGNNFGNNLNQNSVSLSRLDHSAVYWMGNIIVFGGHYGATIDSRGNVVPSEALCDLHLLNTLTSPWSWHQLLQNDVARPKIGRYGHSAFVRKIHVDGISREVMIICGGMRSPERFVNEGYVHNETYNILLLGEVDTMSWLSCDSARLLNNTWCSKNFWIGNTSLNISAEKIVPLPMVFSYCVPYGDNNTLVFGGNIQKKNEFSSGRINNIYDLEFKIKANEPINNKAVVKLLSSAERKMLKGNHQRSAVVHMNWKKHKCTGSAPELGGRCFGSASIHNEIFVYDSRCLFSLNTMNWEWTQLKTLQESISRPIFGSTLSFIGNGEIVRLGGFSHAADSLDVRMKLDQEGYEFLVSPQLIMTSPKANLNDLPSDIRKIVSQSKFKHKFEHEADEIFFTTSFETSEPPLKTFLLKLYEIEDSPLHFLKPCPKFTKCICDIFDPYDCGIVHINTYNSVCSRYGLVRQLVRARLRLEFVDLVRMEKWSPLQRKFVWMGEQNPDGVVDYLRASTTIRMWSHQFDKKYNETKEEDAVNISSIHMSKMKNRMNWAKFDGTLLASSPLTIIELYQLILLETFRNETVTQNDIFVPTKSLLEWAIMSTMSKNGGGNHNHIDFSCIVESAADFIVSFASTKAYLEQEVCTNIINLFKSLSKSFVCENFTRSDVTTLKKILAALYFFSKNHGQRINILTEVCIVPNLFVLRDAPQSDMKSFPQMLLNELFDLKQFTAGSHSLIQLATSMYRLSLTAESSECKEIFTDYSHARTFGVTPFALDTTHHSWHQVVMDNQHLINFNNRRQVCMDFIHFVLLNAEHHRSLLVNHSKYGESPSNNDFHTNFRHKNIIEAQSERTIHAMKVLNLLERNSKFLRNICKELDEKFLQHIKREIHKRHPIGNIVESSIHESRKVKSRKKHMKESNINEAVEEAQKKMIKKDIERKESLLEKVSYIKQNRISKSESKYNLITEKEYLVENILSKKNNELYSDCRQMRGFMLLLLGNLDNVLDGMTSLQTTVTIQWRILRMISYVFVAASKSTQHERSSSTNFSSPPSPLRSSTNIGNSSDKNDLIKMGDNQESSKKLLFPMNDGVAGYAVEFFSYGNGIVSLCRVLSCTFQIRAIAASTNIATSSSNNSTSYQLEHDRKDAIYFTQNKHAPERYATTAVLLVLEWLIVRLKSSAHIRHKIRKMVHQNAGITVPRLEDYNNVAKRDSSVDTILALQVLASIPTQACCGNGDIIADLASKILDCSLDQLFVPKKQVDNVLTHLRAISDGYAVLNRGQWSSERRERKSKMNSKMSLEEQWWVDPHAKLTDSPYDHGIVDEKFEGHKVGISIFLNPTSETVATSNKSNKNGKRDNEDCCLVS